MQTELGTFRDSSDIAHDQEALRRRMTEEGYLYFPQLIEPETVLGVRAQILEELGKVGWLEEGSDPTEARPGELIRRFGDENWWEGYVAIQRLESYHALAHHPGVTGIIGKLVHGELVVQPMKIARVNYPNSDYPTPPHQDYFFVRGHSDVFTAWIPLGDCPSDLGGVQVAPGTHTTGLREVEAAQGAGNIQAILEEGESQHLITADYRAGDVLIFHSLTVHTAPPNRSDRLRISADFRYQSNEDSLVAAVLFPHEFGRGGVPTNWGQLSQDWKSTEWVEVPHSIRIARQRVPLKEAPPSRFMGSTGG